MPRLADSKIGDRFCSFSNRDSCFSECPQQAIYTDSVSSTIGRLPTRNCKYVWCIVDLTTHSRTYVRNNLSFRSKSKLTDYSITALSELLDIETQEEVDLLKLRKLCRQGLKSERSYLPKSDKFSRHPGRS